jgi:myo-inositol catabolism protein IolS
MKIEKELSVSNGKRNLPVLGLGCWAFGGRDWGFQSDTDSLKTIRAAFENGITHFDTAQSYGKGHSEEIVGKALRTVRDKVFIASKKMFFLKEKVISGIELSLRRLNTDYIDLFYMHWPAGGIDLVAIMEEMMKAREKGFIRQIGISNFSVEQMKLVLKTGGIDVHQIGYNLLWRFTEKDLIPFCIENNIPVVTYSTIAQGILTGKFEKNVGFSGDDHREKTVLFEKEVWPHIYSCVTELKKVAEETGRSLTHLAIRWAISRPGVRAVLVGARNPDQIKMNVSALEGDIDSAVFDKLEQISNRYSEWIPNTGNFFRFYP